MSGRPWLLLVIAGCYAPSAAPGAPCNPTTANCPEGQSCLPVGGSYACESAPVAADAPTADTRISDAPRDAPLLVDAPPDAATPAWTLVQTAHAENTSNLTLPSATGTGHLIIVGVQTTAMIAGVTDSGANLYTEVPNSAASASSAGLGISLWSAKSTASATQIIVGASSVNAIVVWEVAGLRLTNPVDTATTLDNQAATTLPVGAAITTAQPGEFVVSIAIVANNVTGLHTNSAFTNDALARGNGWAHLTSATAPAGSHQAKWDQPTSGVYCATSAAFFPGP